MNDAGFLTALQANPFDDETRLVYADWLEERGDVRAGYLRLVAEVVNRLRRGVEWSELRVRLRDLVDVTPLTWRERAGKRFDAVLEAVEPTKLLDTILVVRWRLQVLWSVA